MARTRPQPPKFFTTNLRSLVTTPEVLRLINDITTCTVEWDDQPEVPIIERSQGMELFPCFTLRFQRQPLEVKGSIYPNLAQDNGSLAHLIHLEMGGLALYLRLRTSQTAFLLSPFHCRFLSMLFGRLMLHHLSLASEAQEGLFPFTPYSLEEQVVAGYLQSLYWAPCATIKLDAHDNPYIGSMLHRPKDLRRCEMPGNGREENVIRAYRTFKRLLYYSVEGERMHTGFAILSMSRPLEYYRKRYPSLLFYHEANHTPLEEGLQAIRQFLLNADGRTTFLAMYAGKIVGLLELTRGAQRQLTSVQAWRSVLPLATISYRGRISFWVSLRGRKNSQIPLSVLEYRHGHLHIPLFQDIFWQQLERQLKDVCPGANLPDAMLRLKALLDMLRRTGHGGIFLIGLTDSQLEAPDVPLETQVRLAEPIPLHERWLRHLLGLAKSDGALIFNDRLEACQFQARLKPTNVALPSDRDDLGTGMRHQATREFTAYCPNVLGICISQDAHISLYRHGKLVSRLY